MRDWTTWNRSQTIIHRPGGDQQAQLHRDHGDLDFRWIHPLRVPDQWIRSPGLHSIGKRCMRNWPRKEGKRPKTMQIQLVVISFVYPMLHFHLVPCDSITIVSNVSHNPGSILLLVELLSLRLNQSTFVNLCVCVCVSDLGWSFWWILIISEAYRRQPKHVFTCWDLRHGFRNQILHGWASIDWNQLIWYNCHGALVRIEWPSFIKLVCSNLGLPTN